MGACSVILDRNINVCLVLVKILGPSGPNEASMDVWSLLLIPGPNKTTNGCCVFAQDPCLELSISGCLVRAQDLWAKQSLRGSLVLGQDPWNACAEPKLSINVCMVCAWILGPILASVGAQRLLKIPWLKKESIGAWGLLRIHGLNQASMGALVLPQSLYARLSIRRFFCASSRSVGHLNRTEHKCVFGACSRSFGLTGCLVLAQDLWAACAKLSIRGCWVCAQDP